MVWAALRKPADKPNMDMECLYTLDDAITALYAQLNAPSRRSQAPDGTRMRRARVTYTRTPQLADGDEQERPAHHIQRRQKTDAKTK